MISVILKRRNQVSCIDLIVITTKTSFTVYSAVGAGDAGSTAASPGKYFWANLSEIWAKFGQIWAKVIKIWANMIKFEQNQNLASPKTFDLLRLWLYRLDFSKIGFSLL